MTVPYQVVVVSPRGSGTVLPLRITDALGLTPHGTMSGAGDAPATGPGPGEVEPLLRAAYGRERGVQLLRGEHAELQGAFQAAVIALWRVWWTRLGQPVTQASPAHPALEHRLGQHPDSALHHLLPGRGAWYVTALDLTRADADLLRVWHASATPPIVFHHRDVRDRVISQIRLLTGPADRVGTLPEHLVYRDILTALPTMDARITLALTDPGFPGTAEARHSQWLLRHPRVCVITHEELAGPLNGGTTEARERALTRLLAALGTPEAASLPTLAVPPAHDPDLAVGAWREHFTPEHERLLERRYGDLLAFSPDRPAIPEQATNPRPSASAP